MRTVSLDVEVLDDTTEAGVMAVMEAAARMMHRTLPVGKVEILTESTSFVVRADA